MSKTNDNTTEIAAAVEKANADDYYNGTKYPKFVLDAANECCAMLEQRRWATFGRFSRSTPARSPLTSRIIMSR
jgi:hypothetical protein